MLTEPSVTQADSEDVTAALNAILTTDKFSASPQMSAFLKYVVEQTMAGNTRRIKAFTVGIEALGKSSGFDPQTDPSVRVLAKRLRSSLDAYYEKNPETPVFIEMKPGSYVPKFLLRSEMANIQTADQNTAMGFNTSATPAETTNASPAAPLGSTGQTAHLSVPQQQSLADSKSEESTAESEEAKKGDISQLWQTYKSASKVA